MPDFQTDSSLVPGPCVYVIRVVGTDHHKIGFTTNIQNRFTGWRMNIPFLDLDLSAIYFARSARKLEKRMHHHFSKYRIGTSEWFDLPEDQQDLFTKPTSYWVDLFQISTTEREDEQDDELVEEHKPRESNKKPAIERESKKPERLERLPNYQKLDDPPTIQDEFEFGLLPEMLELYDELQSWDAVGGHYGVSGKIARNVAELEVMPMDNNNRRKFGLCMTYPDFEDGSGMTWGNSNEP